MAKRRSNNEGTVYRRDDGKYRTQVTIDGKRISHQASTQQECLEWRKRILAQSEQGLSFKGAQMKLGDFLELWLKMIMQNRRPKTYLQYQANIKKYILPKFGGIRLRDLHPIKIEVYLTSLQTAGVGDRTVQIVFGLLHNALANAVKKGLIGRNPMDAVDKPRVRNPKKITVLNPAQIQQFLIAAEASRNRALYHLAIATGLREGEILALKWSDIDWENSRLKVQRQVQRIPKVGLVFTEPKTAAGVRILALGGKTMEKLVAQQKRQEWERTVARTKWQESNLVFPTPVGTPMDPRNLWGEFKEILKKAGLPDMRFHDLRHTSITMVLNDIGAPIKEAQRRAGHTRPSTTIDIYGGEASSKLDEIVAQGLDDLITPIEIDITKHSINESCLSYT